MVKGMFSLVLPVYKVEPFIAQCIKSLLKQTYQNFELIFVNDNSPDKSLEIIERYAQNDERIKIISNPTNYGVGKTRNIGVEAAQGEYLCVLDPDDWVEPYYFETIKEAFDKNPDVQSVWFKMWTYFANYDAATANPSCPTLIHLPEGQFEFNHDRIMDFPIYAWARAYRLCNFKENGFKWSEGMYFEEICLHYHYFMTNPKTYIINKFLHYYRQREGSFTRDPQIERRKIKDFYKALSITENLIDEKEFNPEYKKSLYEYAKNYKKQYNKNEELNLLAEENYNNFLNNHNKKL